MADVQIGTRLKARNTHFSHRKKAGHSQWASFRSWASVPLRQDRIPPRPANGGCSDRDTFEGTQYAFFTPEKGWSQPVGVFSIVGQRASSSRQNPTAPSQWRMFRSGHV